MEKDRTTIIENLEYDILVEKGKLAKMEARLEMLKNLKVPETPAYFKTECIATNEVCYYKIKDITSLKDTQSIVRADVEVIETDTSGMYYTIDSRFFDLADRDVQPSNETEFNEIKKKFLSKIN